MYGYTFPFYLDELTVLSNKVFFRILQTKGRTRCEESLYLQYNTLSPVQLNNYHAGIESRTQNGIFSLVITIYIPELFTLTSYIHK